MLFQSWKEQQVRLDPDLGADKSFVVFSGLDFATFIHRKKFYVVPACGFQSAVLQLVT
jgi:hypothetical protein